MQEAVDRIKEEFLPEGVGEFLGAAGGFVAAEHGVEFDLDALFRGGSIVAQIKREHIGGRGEIHGTGVEGGHFFVVDDRDGPLGILDVEQSEGSQEMLFEPAHVRDSGELGLICDGEVHAHAGWERAIGLLALG
jgi:hypothetical protein